MEEVEGMFVCLFWVSSGRNDVCGKAMHMMNRAMFQSGSESLHVRVDSRADRNCVIDVGDDLGRREKERERERDVYGFFGEYALRLG